MFYSQFISFSHNRLQSGVNYTATLRKPQVRAPIIAERPDRLAVPHHSELALLGAGPLKRSAPTTPC